MKLMTGTLRIAAMTACSLLALTLASPAVAQMGFSISVDGTHVAGDAIQADPRRETDRRLATADIQVTFDGLVAKPSLNVLPVNRRTVYRAGERVEFIIDANYAPWIARSEVLIYEVGKDRPVAVLPGQIGKTIGWQMPTDTMGEFAYLARVYDRNGRFDETLSLPLKRGDDVSSKADDLPLWGDDRTGVRSIAVEGGMVTVHGKHLPAGGRVHILGEDVPVDARGAFVTQRILPAGDHSIAVAVEAANGDGMVFTRDINIPTQDWFYVGMADLTLGKRWGEGVVIDANPEEFDGVYAKGRAAFYLKGKIKGEYLLTASADTGEGPLSEIFSGVLSSDPQALLRRIDPNQYYPVYGDDSVMVDDAPTRGKLYVRLERGNNSVMWGTFRTLVGNSALLRSERVLYGAAARGESDAATAGGAPIYEGDVYAAQPGTLPARDVLRGTGGSAYVLRRQDIVAGSETISIERRNAVSGLIVSTTTLRAGVDYSINYLQGLVMLSRPLSASQRSDGAVQSSSDDIVNLVAQYEFSPPNADLDEFAYGGSGTLRLGDAASLGVVGMTETVEDGRDLRVYGANARLAPTENTFLEAEILRSEGAALSNWHSADGGLTYVQQPAVAGASAAYAYRLKGQVSLDDVLAKSFDAVAGFTLERREAGFSTIEQQVREDTLAFNGFVRAQLTADLALALNYDHVENAVGARRDELKAEASYQLSADWAVAFGLLHRDDARPGNSASGTGARTDVGTRVTYSPSDDVSVYGFGQTTLYNSVGFGRNDRFGAGVDLGLAETWTLSGEASTGTSGPQALATVSHESEPGKRTYVGVRVSPEAQDDFFVQNKALSGLVMGTQQRVNEAVSVRSENTFGLFSDAGSATGLYGVDFTHDAHWSSWGTYETGRIVEQDVADFERHALSVGFGYKDDGIDWANRAELRFEDSADGSRNRTTALLKSGLSVKTDDDWRALAGFDGLFSRSDQSAILDGDYIEASLGAAYRPVNNDRFNALFRYTYLYDLPGPDQVSRAGRVLGPAQRTHILSVDGNYDLTQWLTVGAKYGVRFGEVSQSRDIKDFVASTMHLGVIRADLKVIEDWAVLLEARALYNPEASIADFGALAALSYDVTEQVRLTLGYNFGQFSDDLRDVSYDDHGVFFNMAAKF